MSKIWLITLLVQTFNDCNIIQSSFWQLCHNLNTWSITSFEVVESKDECRTIAAFRRHHRTKLYLSVQMVTSSLYSWWKYKPLLLGERGFNPSTNNIPGKPNTNSTEVLNHAPAQYSVLTKQIHLEHYKIAPQFSVMLVSIWFIVNSSSALADTQATFEVGLKLVPIKAITSRKG